MIYVVVRKSAFNGTKTIMLRTKEKGKAEDFCSRFSRCWNSENAYIDTYGNVIRIEKRYI